MNITLLGAGAIGALWAIKLTQQQHNVQLWTRNSETETTLHFSELTSSTTTDNYHFNCNDPQALAASELLIVTVKAFQVITALTPLLPHLSTDCVVVIMHNGIGSQQQVQQLLPHNPIIYATTSQAAFKPTPTTIQHTGLGQTWLGAINEQAQAQSHIAGLFNAALSPSQWHATIYQPLWQKLAINCAINPLTAINQCSNGDLAHSCYHSPLDSICFEVAQVMTAEGFSTTPQQLRHQVDTVIKATANNYSSMNRDIYHHRLTEIDYISGYLVQQAQRHHINTPVNQQLWQTIKHRESQDHE
ncbi:2-dehydropantoate 2-reductase [Photobacterium phosphoreum]|uniref:2-dehydropantoate 2-reductase n=1 Tax=Photobacterium phosphoreum TaxID=659 RepID=UPI000D163BC4|nr:2-dehydropantoate 2-reductase [Photobacterium phosphoreum]PSW35236.1 2-dehydropantoate 2-reductase [Photobacterium phosphoreum]